MNQRPAAIHSTINLNGENEMPGLLNDDAVKWSNECYIFANSSGKIRTKSGLKQDKGEDKS